jgi:hypothetical protein
MVGPPFEPVQIDASWGVDLPIDDPVLAFYIYCQQRRAGLEMQLEMERQILNIPAPERSAPPRLGLMRRLLNELKAWRRERWPEDEDEEWDL